MYLPKGGVIGLDAQEISELIAFYREEEKLTMSKRSPKISGPIEFEPPASKMSSGLLEAAVQATQTGSSCFASMADIAPLLTHPSGQLVEYNDAMTDGSGRIALRATAAGVQVFQSNGNGAAPQTQTWPATVGNPGDYEQPAPQQPLNWMIPPGSPPPEGYTIASPAGLDVLVPRPVFKDGIPIPSPRTRRESTKKYRFDEMNVGQCFDTLPSGDSPEPWKKLASACSAASKRFAPKKFETWPIEEGGVKFARTWRTA